MNKNFLFCRILDLEEVLKNKSFFLLGPRQTGKTTLLKEIKGCLYINLLDPDDYLSLCARPLLLKELIKGRWPSPTSARHSGYKAVVIDEIQKLPSLLDVVHLLMEEDKRLRFLLTGSSARKLRAHNVNTLGGRAGKQLFLPIVSEELRSTNNHNKNINDLLQYGGLPSVLLATDPWDKLKDYVGLYLREEIQAEALTRNLQNFSRFLQTSALINGEQLNYTKVANDAQVPARTVKDYFQVLEDTLVGYQLESFRPKISRKFVSIPKFYFFDIGVANYLLGRKSLSKGTGDYGKAVEHLVFTELFAYIHLVKHGDARIFYWRTQTQQEVDFIIDCGEGLIAIEVKASGALSAKHFHGMKALSNEVKLKKKIFVSTEKHRRLTENHDQIYPLELFLEELWRGDLF